MLRAPPRRRAPHPAYSRELSTLTSARARQLGEPEPGDDFLSGRALAGARAAGMACTRRRCCEHPPEDERHTQLIPESSARLLALARGSWANLNQATIFYQGEHLREHVLQEWRARGGDAAST